jgi:hypothetical protein
MTLASNPPATERSAPVDGALQPLTRAGIAVLLALAVANGVFLYLLPGLADTDYAWSIKPPVNAAFLGAGYLAGAVATALSVFAANRWRSVQPLGPALIVLSVLLLAATIIHEDKFRWGYPPTWVWTFVYAIAPAAIVILMGKQRAITTVPAADPRLRTLRVVSLAAGIVLIAGGVLLFALPVELGEHWAWALTPLLARAVAAWYAMVGTALVWCGLGMRTSGEITIPYATLASWSALLLLLPALHSDDMTGTDAALVAYLVAMAALLALAVYALTRADRSDV